MTLSVKTEPRKQQYVLSELIGIENKSPRDAHKAISIVLYNQSKTIEKLRNDNKQLWIQVQQHKTLNQNLSANMDDPQVIVNRIWDNEEDEFWDTF